MSGLPLIAVASLTACDGTAGAPKDAGPLDLPDVDYGGIEFYDRSTGAPVGSFNYGRRDTCEAYDRGFTGLPTPCLELPFPCLDAGFPAGD